MNTELSPETLRIDMDEEPLNHHSQSQEFTQFDQCFQCQDYINVNNYDHYKDDDESLITCPNCQHKQKV